MSDVIRRPSADGKHLMQGWGLSLLLHLVFVLSAVTIMPKMTIVLESQPFRWDVALIKQDILPAEAPTPAPAIQPPQPVRTEPARPVERTSETRVATPQSKQVVHPVIEPPQPQPVQPVQEMAQAQYKPAEPKEVKQPDVRELRNQEPVSEPIRETAQATEPVAPAPASAVPQPVTEASTSVPVAETVPPAPPSLAPAPSAKLFEEPSPSAASTPQSSDPPSQMARLMPPSAPHVSEAKPDHRWVGESLWRRVAELKRYPSSARLNGLEGRVVLKAIIRADGHLAEVSVVKSSGHPVLDAAAIEAVKLACPLHMKHSIGPPQVAVSLPIVYSLAN